MLCYEAIQETLQLKVPFAVDEWASLSPDPQIVSKALECVQRRMQLTKSETAMQSVYYTAIQNRPDTIPDLKRKRPIPAQKRVNSRNTTFKSPLRPTTVKAESIEKHVGTQADCRELEAVRAKHRRHTLYKNYAGKASNYSLRTRSGH